MNSLIMDISSELSYHCKGFTEFFEGATMEHIWSPWRMEYILIKKPKGCFFCENLRESKDVENYILYRGEGNFVILNSYPYNPGHLLIAPYRHLRNLEDLSNEEFKEHFELIRKAIEVLKKTFNPQGFNVGMNLGKVAGAGVEDHIHTHIVPRWNGDTNFMPVVGGTRVIPEALVETYAKLKEIWNSLANSLETV